MGSGFPVYPPSGVKRDMFWKNSEDVETKVQVTLGLDTPCEKRAGLLDHRRRDLLCYLM